MSLVTVTVQHIPGWVWAFLIVAMMFFGVLYLIPEARQAVGEVLDHKAIQVQPLRSPKAAEFRTKDDAVRVCGYSNVSGPWIEPQSMRESYYCEH
jgi:hypothetical protein